MVIKHVAAGPYFGGKNDLLLWYLISNLDWFRGIKKQGIRTLCISYSMYKLTLFIPNAKKRASMGCPSSYAYTINRRNNNLLDTYKLVCLPNKRILDNIYRLDNHTLRNE